MVLLLLLQSLLGLLISIKGISFFGSYSFKFPLNLANTITDLMTVTEIQQAVSTGGWVFTGASSSSRYYNCAGTTILGGYLICGKGCSISKNFSGLSSPHTLLEIKFSYYAGNSWDDEYAKLISGTNILWSVIGRSTSSADSHVLCGTTSNSSYQWWTRIFNISLVIQHTDPYIHLKWTSTLNSDPNDEWLGILKVNITPYNCHESCLTCTNYTPTACATCDTNTHTFDPSTKRCLLICPDGQYLNYDTYQCSSKFTQQKPILSKLTH